MFDPPQGKEWKFYKTVGWKLINAKKQQKTVTVQP